MHEGHKFFIGAVVAARAPGDQMIWRFKGDGMLRIQMDFVIAHWRQAAEYSKAQEKYPFLDEFVKPHPGIREQVICLAGSNQFPRPRNTRDSHKMSQLLLLPQYDSHLLLIAMIADKLK